MDISQERLRHLSIKYFIEQLDKVNKHVFKAPSKLNILEYAQQRIILPSDFANPPGYYSTDRNHWQEEILTTISSPTQTRTVLMIGSQMGKSVLQLTVLVYYVDQKPAPILVVVPNHKMAADFSLGRFVPTIKSSGLAHLFKREEDGSNTTLYKKYLGGQLWFRSAGAQNDLTGITAAVVLLDEVDKYEQLPNGCPVALAEQRAHVFGENAKFIYTSTPLIKGDSRIENLYEDSDQRIYQHKCIHCDEYFTPVWELVKWESNGDLPNPESALLHCPHCGCGHDDLQRNTAVRRGRWLVQNPGHKIAGFHANALTSYVPLAMAVRKYLAALNDPLKMQQFTNEVLGLPYEEQGEKFDNIEFASRLEPYTRATIPEDVLFLTAGVDTQADRLECVVYGWGKDFESWVIDDFIIHGPPDDPFTFEQLHSTLRIPYTRSNGSIVRLLRTAIDLGGYTEAAGGFSEHVKKFCKQKAKFGYLAVKGANTAQKSIFPANRKKADFYMIDTHQAKTMFFNNLKKTKHGPGYVHFYDGLSEDFFDQLTGEQKVVIKKNGTVKVVWEKLKGAQRVEKLDCTVYALAARLSLAVNVERQRWKKDPPLPKPVIEPEPEPIIEIPPPEVSEPNVFEQHQVEKKKKARPIPPRRRGSWLDNLRY